MKKFLMTLILGTALCTSGCVYLIVGGIGALGGYIVSPDTVEGIIAYDSDEVWYESEEVAGIMGVILEGKESSGLMIAKINGGKVTITITQVSKSTTKLTIKARKSFFPKIGLAQDVYTKIVTRLNE